LMRHGPRDDEHEGTPIDVPDRAGHPGTPGATS
jgi:hypothetical protein